LSIRRNPLDLSWCDVPHREPFICDIAIDSSQISGVVAHVSNIEFVRWLDRAAELHADSLGYTRRWMLDHGGMWFVARHEINYLAEAVLGDDLVIATWVRDMRKVKSWRDYAIVRPTDQTIVCRGKAQSGSPSFCHPSQAPRIINRMALHESHPGSAENPPCESENLGNSIT
jgi:YbgC/YbaW family acyl-CoA thioester hydrolase